MNAVLSSVTVLAAVGLAIAADVAAAQPVGEITVVAPITVREAGRTPSGGVVERVTITHRVTYRDLDLAKSADAAALKTRVEASAKLACKQLTEIYPLVPVDPDCVQKSLKGAMAQANAAIAAAGRR